MTFGAPAGALIPKFGGIFAFRASSSLNVGGFGSWIGSTVRSGTVCAAAVMAHAMTSAMMKKLYAGFVFMFFLTLLQLQRVVSSFCTAIRLCIITHSLLLSGCVPIEGPVLRSSARERTLQEDQEGRINAPDAVDLSQTGSHKGNIHSGPPYLFRCSPDHAFQ
jgi:hypothetical protein